MQAVEQGIPGLRGFAYTDHWCGFVECVWEVGAWFCSLFHLFIVPNPDLIQRIHLPFAAIFFFQMNRSEHSGNLCGCVKNKNSNPISIYIYICIYAKQKPAKSTSQRPAAMDVFFLASGEPLATLDAVKFEAQVAKILKQSLAPELGIPVSWICWCFFSLINPPLASWEDKLRFSILRSSAAT